MRGLLLRLWPIPIIGTEPASIGTLLLGIAALATALVTAALHIRDKKIQAAQAEAARKAAEAGEDDSYVSRSLKTMEESQKWLKEENSALRRRIDELDKELHDRDRVHMIKLGECQARCDALRSRIELLERGHE